MTTESGSHREHVLGGLRNSPVSSGLPKLPHFSDSFGSVVKNALIMQEMQGTQFPSLGEEDPLE